VRKPKISLRTGLSTVIVLCWLAPILLLVTVFGVLIGQSYQRSARQEMNDKAQFALLQMQSELESAVSDSKSVSYDGVIRSAYRSYRESRNKIALYRSANEYLRDNFSRALGYRAVFLVFWDEEINANAYAFCAGESGSALIRDCQEATPVILDAMREQDTRICFQLIDDQLYLTRNLLDSHFEPYATIVIMLRPSVLFAPLSVLGDQEALQLQLDELCFGYDGEEGVERRQEEDGYRYETELEGHSLCLLVAAKAYNAWKENPWLNWVAGGAALLVLPLLLLLWLLWRRHVSLPVETLVEANMKVQAGERGYEITQHAPNTEFETLFEHFNDMSAEMKAQFERSYLEQQASQRAQIKALQSQINPHFLNNTLEVINWEARLAGNDRVGAMIEALSTMLDAALDRDGRTQIPLRQELGYVDAYLYIIRERLGEGFRVHKEIDESLLQRQVPRLILQPIVENAVEHDMTRNGGGELWLRVYRQENMLVLEVEHEGSMTEADREKIAGQLRSGGEISGSVGIQNVNQRLKLIYGEDGSLSLDETGRGTILARICFPLAEEGE
jgi:two-component system sensor histidine kinase YesM